MKKVRLNKYLAECGIASRRKADEMIFEGKVKVNGRVITEMGFQIEPSEDAIKVNNKMIRSEQKIYILLHKPEGYVCTVADEKDRKTVVDLLRPVIRERVYPVGRLDFNTTGCLLITNDGDWSNKVIHPKFEIKKTYRAKVKGRIPTRAIERLRRGVKVDGKFVKAVSARVYQRGDENDTIELVIVRGLNHQVKKMMEVVGLAVVRLKRESVGKLTVKGLDAGSWRYLSQTEISYFEKEVRVKVIKKKPEGERKPKKGDEKEERGEYKGKKTMSSGKKAPIGKDKKKSSYKDYKAKSASSKKKSEEYKKKTTGYEYKSKTGSEKKEFGGFRRESSASDYRSKSSSDKRGTGDYDTTRKKKSSPADYRSKNSSNKRGIGDFKKKSSSSGYKSKSSSDTRGPGNYKKKKATSFKSKLGSGVGKKRFIASGSKKRK